MRIGGIQKFSLIDYPGKISAVIFTQGCNLRCPYCHNPELVLPELFQTIVPESIVFAFLEQRRHQLDAVVITGGEPTIQADLMDFIREIRTRGFLIKLDTNGTNPDILRSIVDEKLIDYIAMDIKAPFTKYAGIAGADVDLERIKESIAVISSAGLACEFRTTFDERRLSMQDIEQIQESIGNTNYYIQECLLRSEKPHLATYATVSDMCDMPA
jgi:pyruvate formate lyase activating enzyme